ncbi:glycosyltransferase [Pantoea sp.]|uniref:glycosyltransferase n=1 Tax=Pantoea sp. TaxID=69393 RepID=UPI0028A04F62|nr:glycosyltransferase [Pantoea sp.]
MDSQRMAQVDWSSVEKIIYINLKKRPDRDAHIRQELIKLNVPQEKIIRFEAIERNPGYIGCSHSHLAVLKLAQNMAWKTVLVLEDDMAFLHDEENIGRVNHFFHQLTLLPWDVALLSANYFDVAPLKVDKSFLFEYECIPVKPMSAYCACAYLVQEHYYPTLIESFSSGVKLIEETRDERHAVDAYWLNIMPRDNWIGIYPNFGYQMANKSDIRNCDVNYEKLFFKSLSSIVQ